MNSEGRDQGRVGADLHAVANPGTVFVKAVVVTGDSAGANVGVTPNLGIADVSQVLGLGVRADHGLFDLDEVANLCPRGQHCPPAQVGKRTDYGLISEFAVA